MIDKRSARKVCRTCNTEKDLRLFHKRTRSRDGRQHECILCTRARNLRNYYLARDRRLAVQRQRRSTAEFRLKDNAWRRQYRATPKGRQVRLEADRFYRGWKRLEARA